MAELIIVQGFLGAGKTTYSKKAANETGALRLNVDEYCQNCYSMQDLEYNWDKCFAEGLSQLWLIAEHELKNGNSVILDFGFWDRASRDYARATAKRLGIEFKHIYIQAPDHILLERLKKRSGPIAEKNIENFELIKSNFEEPEQDEEHVSMVSL